MQFKVGDIITHKVYNEKSYRVNVVDGLYYQCSVAHDRTPLKSRLYHSGGGLVIQVRMGQEAAFHVHDYGFSKDLEKILTED